MNAATPETDPHAECQRAVRMRGYAEAQAIARRAIIEEALRILMRNDYASMQQARILLEKAVANMGEP